MLSWLLWVDLAGAVTKELLGTIFCYACDPYPCSCSYDDSEDENE